MSEIKTYSEKLKDPRWQKKRLLILDRDNWACRCCEDTTTSLQIHHESYSNNTEPWDYPDENLITMCEHCHQVLEDMKKQNAVLVDCFNDKPCGVKIYRCRDIKSSKIFFGLKDKNGMAITITQEAIDFIKNE